MGKKAAIQKKPKHDSDCEKVIRKMEREIKRLKSENRTLSDALSKTEAYVIALSSDKTIERIFEEIQEKMEIKTKQLCPKCNSEHLNKINLGNLSIVSCSCGYRNRINEPGTS